MFNDHMPMPHNMLFYSKINAMRLAQHKTSSSELLWDNRETETSHLKFKHKTFITPLLISIMYIYADFFLPWDSSMETACCFWTQDPQSSNKIQNVPSLYVTEVTHTHCTSFSADLQENYFAQAEDLIQHTQLFLRLGCQVRSAVIKSQVATWPAEIQFYPVSTEWA